LQLNSTIVSSKKQDNYTMNHQFNVKLAVDFSVNIALFLDHLKFWTFRNLANKTNIHDGLCWAYDTIDAMADIFPYWSKSQRETVIKSALDAELIVKGNFNKTRFDRTVWYALTPNAYAYFDELLNDKYLTTLYLSISEKSEMDFLEFRNGFPKNRITIPDTDPDTDPDILKPPIIPLKNEKQEFGLNEMLEENPHAIEKSLIEDWLIIRKRKRAAVTKNGWSLLQKTMEKVKKSFGITALEQFERMVSSGWTSIQYEYFDKRPISVNKGLSYDDVMGA
jgi:hypothetical protein